MPYYARVKGVNNREMAVKQIEDGEIIEVWDPEKSPTNIALRFRVFRDAIHPDQFVVVAPGAHNTALVTRKRATWALLAAEKLCRGEDVKP